MQLQEICDKFDKISVIYNKIETDFFMKKECNLKSLLDIFSTMDLLIQEFNLAFYQIRIEDNEDNPWLQFILAALLKDNEEEYKQYVQKYNIMSTLYERINKVIMLSWQPHINMGMTEIDLHSNKNPEQCIEEKE